MLISKMDFTTPKDLYVGYHYFLGIYHLLPFGSSEMHAFEYSIFHSNILISVIHIDSLSFFFLIPYTHSSFPALIFILAFVFISVLFYMHLLSFMNECIFTLNHHFLVSFFIYLFKFHLFLHFFINLSCY